ncbi:MAG: hypothetical protein JWM59_1018 [Verrucomicrobiales bacterium]|nr:hypothetical protein [Verrucomicrobiales bacterium]
MLNPMTRRKRKKQTRAEALFRGSRIAKLLERRLIADASEIPAQAIPCDADSGTRWLYYINQPITCQDCGAFEIWKAEDQLWFFEVHKAPIYKWANRCLPCRHRERERKLEARRRAGHAPAV